MWTVSTKELEDAIKAADYQVFILSKKLPRNIEQEELKGAAYLGIAKAIERFNPDAGFKFVTFTRSFVYGAMIDFIRENSPYTRTDIAKGLATGVTLSLSSPVPGVASNSKESISFEDFIASSDDSIEDVMIRKEAVSLAVASWNDRLNRIMYGLCEEERRLNQVGKEIGLSESRTSQLRSEAIQKAQRAERRRELGRRIRYGSNQV